MGWREGGVGVKLTTAESRGVQRQSRSEDQCESAALSLAERRQENIAAQKWGQTEQEHGQMLSPFLQQSRQSCVLLLLHGCLGRGASRACRLATAVRTGARTGGGDRSFGEPVRERWPDRRLGALRGQCTSASRDGKTEKEARRFDNSDGKKLSKSQQLKQVFKEYGAVGVVFHTAISLTSLGMFYLAVSSGVDVAAILYKVGCDEAVVQSRMAAGTSTFLLAYAVHKVFAPVRMSITLVSVPLMVRYFRKIGLFKASPSKPRGTI